MAITTSSSLCFNRRTTRHAAFWPLFGMPFAPNPLIRNS